MRGQSRQRNEPFLEPDNSQDLLGAMVLSLAFCLFASGCGDSLGQLPERGPAGTTQLESTGFQDVAAEAGIAFEMSFLPREQGVNFKINLYDHGCGVAVADYDGDGHDDVYFLNQLGGNALYRNNGDGTFEDTTEEAGGLALSDRICVSATFADFDNDSDQDLYVTSTRGGNSLFENLGNSRFRDITSLARLSCTAHSQTAAFFDFDNDGDLDLFLTNTADWTSGELDEQARYYPGSATLWELGSSPKEYNILYKNNGDRTFSDVTEQAGVAGLGWGGDVAAMDYDEDGRTDLLVTNMFGRSQLYRNLDNGSFLDVTRTTLGKTTWGAIGAKPFDFNNDGHLDIMIVDMHSDMWMPPEYDSEQIEEGAKYPYVTGPVLERGLEAMMQLEFDIQYGEVIFGNSLFKNLGEGKFVEVSDTANMETFWPWGIAAGDFDNDGLVDVFLPSGMGYPYFYWRNYLMMNNGDETFHDASREQGIEPPRGGRTLPVKIGGKPAHRSSRCAAVSDFDGDGRLDIVVNNFNGPAYFYRNQFPPQNYVAFKLTGTTSNADAIGARVDLFLKNTRMVRMVHAAGGYLSQSSKTLSFGLGQQTAIDRAVIHWPSGITQTISNPAINKLHSILEVSAPQPHKRN